MITPDDPRHGSPAGYTQGCREACCRRAKKNDRLERERMMAAGHEFSIPRERVVRKIHALMAMGWTSTLIGEVMGQSGQSVMQFTRLAKDTCFAAVAERYDAAYRALEMKVPPDDIYTRRMKNKARKAGWLPPLAWEDIDAGVLATADETTGRPFLDRFDEDEIDYVLQYHDFTRRLSKFEKAEVVRRWLADGRSERSLCALTGWREGRYRDPRPTNQEAA